MISIHSLGLWGTKPRGSPGARGAVGSVARPLGLRAAGDAGRVRKVVPPNVWPSKKDRAPKCLAPPYVNMMSKIQRIAQKMGGPTLFFTPRMATCG